jgi:diphthine-ammonia ligase
MACYLAMQKGLAVSRLVHFDRPFNLHGIDPELIRLQAKLAGIPMVQKRVANEDFEQEFRNTAESLKLEGIAGMVFGDIYLEPHKEWVDRVCGELGMAAEEPLWRMNTEKIMNDFLALGFETIIASGKPENGPCLHRVSQNEGPGHLRRERRIPHLRDRRPAVQGTDRDIGPWSCGQEWILVH